MVFVLTFAPCDVPVFWVFYGHVSFICGFLSSLNKMLFYVDA